MDEKLREQLCPYCGQKPDGAMLVMGKSMAHAICVIWKLNELLDPDYDGSKAPAKSVGFLISEYEPVQLEPLTDEETIRAVCGDCPFEGRFTNEDCHACQRRLRANSQATITKAQAKGQLYRKVEGRIPQNPVGFVDEH